MEVMIKLGNLQQLQVLEDLMLAKFPYKDDNFVPVKLSFHNFVVEVIRICQAFVASELEAINMFIVEDYISKYKYFFYIRRYFYGLLAAWRKYSDCYEYARELLSLLSAERSNRYSIRLFLRVRKAILKSVGVVIMQYIILTHYIIAISHNLFSQSLQAFVQHKTTELFVTLKRRSINSCKVNGAVVCEFLLNCVYKHAKSKVDNIILAVNRNRHKSPGTRYFSKSPQKSGLYSRQNLLTGTNFDPRKGMRPYKSQGKLGNHSMLINNHEESREETINIEYYISKFHQLNNGLDRNRNRTGQNSYERFENAKDIVSKRYPESWRKLIHTNQILKEKLLGKPVVFR